MMNLSKGLVVFASVMLSGASVAQTIDDPYGDYTQAQCQQIAQYCGYNWQTEGFASPAACYDAYSQGRCPDRPYNPNPPPPVGPPCINFPEGLDCGF